MVTDVTIQDLLDMEMGECVQWLIENQHTSELMKKWQTIETAPKDGKEILLFSVFDTGLCYWRDDEVMQGWTWGLEQRFNNPTHWMSLPEPPAL